MSAQGIPNFLFLMADDHTGYVLGCDGNPLASTPNLDRLAAQGVRLANHYCNSPVCSPSRQSIFTGRMPHAAGVTVNSNALDPNTPTLARQLATAGYDTAVFGVMHFNRPSEPGLHGFATVGTEDVIGAKWSKAPYDPVPPEIRVKPQWKPFADPARVWLNSDVLPYPRYERDMQSDVILRSAQDFLEAHTGTPFALWLSFPEPHSPYNFPVEDVGAFDPAQFTPPPIGPNDQDQVPLIFRDLSEEDKQGIIASYYTSVRYLDRTIGRVLDSLDSLGLAQDTLVVYLPDHGYCLGQHGRFEKHTCYDPALRVPCILRWPDRIEAQVVTDLTESADIAPTILELLEAPPLSGAHGRSLAGRITGDESYMPHEFVFSEYLGNEEASVRTDKWKFIHCTGQRSRTDGYVTANPTPGRYVRLFDLTEDPNEFVDVAAQNPSVVEQLSGLMLERFQSTHPMSCQEPIGLDTPDALDWYLRA